MLELVEVEVEVEVGFYVKYIFGAGVLHLASSLHPLHEKRSPCLAFRV